MAVESFGQFLVNKGLLEPDELAEALGDIDPERLTRLAVAKRILLPEEIGMLNERYGSSFTKMLKKAVKAGMMSEEQLAYLERLQLGDWRGLVSSLTEKGKLDPHQLNDALQEFNAQQAAYRIEPKQVPPHMQGRAYAVALINMTERMFYELCNIIVGVGEAEEWSGPTHQAGVGVEISLAGDYTARLILIVDQTLAMQVAFGMVGEGEQLTADDVRDAWWEFANNVVGAAAGALGKMGQEMTFGTPAVYDPQAANAALGSGLRCQITSHHGVGELLVS